MTGEVLLVATFLSLGHFSDIAKGTTEVTRNNRPALSPTTLDFLGFLSLGVYFFLQILSSLNVEHAICIHAFIQTFWKVSLALLPLEPLPLSKASKYD